MMIKTEAQPTDLCAIEVYLPTTNSKDEEVAVVYEQIDDLMKLVKEKDNLSIISDFNASIGEENKGLWNGKFGLGKTNARGERLLDFCEQYEMIVTNTCFEMPKRRIYTWKSPTDGKMFQIDYILVKKKFMNQIKSSHSYPGYDIDSDHVLVIADYSSRFMKYKRTNQHRWFVKKLKEKQVAADMKELTDT
ncbi:craniofacial development protein 2-like [Schistocerca nitens]|uniref:craniofacial development protein 2-like n=1 Tax=Schistocerca nitens TaxID=7011 RepID=UPI002118DFA1|nr:craniofacial development protein 2-like [Schistocerca nitens]